MLLYMILLIKRSRLTVWLTLLASCCAPLLAAQATAPNGNEIIVTGAFSRQRTFPEASNGYLFSFVRSPQPGAANIVLTSLDSGVRTEVTFAVEGAASLQLEDVSVTANQRVLVAGLLTRSDTGRKETFLAATDFTGNTVWRSNLGTYFPQRLCGAVDGTVWVLGHDMKKEISKHDYDLLRTYSADGQFQHSYFSRRNLRLSVDGIMNLGHDAPALLSCGDQSVGMYLGTASIPLWYEVQLATGTVQQLFVKHRENYRISGMSLTSKGTVFASFQSVRNNKSAGLYTLVSAASNNADWVPVSGPNVTHVARLLGGNGTSLVYVQQQIPDADGPVVQVKAAELSLSNRPEISAPLKRALPAQTQEQGIPREKVGSFIEMASKAVSDAKAVCKSATCTDTVKELERSIEDWKQRNASNTLTTEDDTKIQKDILKNIQKLQDLLKADYPDDFALLLNNGGRCSATPACSAALKSNRNSGAILMLTDAHDTCVQNCDRLFNIFTGICAAYAAVSPVAAAICELVVVQQYYKCLNNCPPPTPGCS